MQISNAYELLRALKQSGYIKNERDPYWWPQSGRETVIIEAILTQQTKWENVERSMATLRKQGLDSLAALCECDLSTLAEAIRPSGFYRTKAPRLQALARAVIQDFGDFDTFQSEATREWLLARKGIGPESADSILCYACLQPVMVVDSYTARLLGALGYMLDSYDAIQAWFIEGIEKHRNEAFALYDEPIDLARLYARFHGKIVEFAKEYIRGNKVDLSGLSKNIEELR